MPTTRQVAVWIDHHEAKIFHVSAGAFTTSEVRPADHHLHHRATHGETGHPADAKHFFDDVVRALAGAEEILLVGPSTAKLEFVRHLHKHDRTVEPKVIGVETVDHPTDAQFAAFVRRYFLERAHPGAGQVR